MFVESIFKNYFFIQSNNNRNRHIWSLLNIIKGKKFIQCCIYIYIYINKGRVNVYKTWKKLDES